MTTTSTVTKRRDEIAGEIPRREAMLHEMQYHIVEQSRHHIVALVTVDSHSPRLVAQQRGVEQKELADGGLVTVVDTGKKLRGSRIAVGHSDCTPTRYSSCRRTQFRSDDSICRSRGRISPG